ncbi:RNA-binding protein [Plasmodium gonderi]|uniref:RNA-binding protein n=1 Tax=Plasmodium gonderi TaxID=77519 RepID=A0A1Y1JIQ1_PLAGO|nr:RNA-binding protein [Plasmodium gonderi]GAW81077.1 RNA-binding protein [Plasmodium gonderi]
MNDNCLYVYNLTKNVSSDHLKEIFMHFGNLKEINFVLNDEKLSGNNNEGNFICAKIKFENEMDAKIAREYMNGGQIDGKTVSIKYEHVMRHKEKHKNEKHNTKRENKERIDEKRKYLRDGTKYSSSPSRSSKYSFRKSISSQVRRKKKGSRKK